MTDEELAPLVELAAESGESLTDTWGRSAVVIAGAVDLTRLNELATRSGYSVTAFYGTGRVPLELGSAIPEEHDLADLAALATNEREAAEVRAAESALDVAEMLTDLLEDVTVSYARPGWARTEAAFIDAVTESWIAVAETIPPHELRVGSTVIELMPVVDRALPGRLPVNAPTHERPGSPGDTVWDVVGQIADAAAWTQIAVAVDRSNGVRLALHSDQEPVLPLALSDAGGGLDLLRWWLGGPDGDREEALRHVLRFTTASSPLTLPAARIVQRLAERQRIALARDRAAEVFRAIADGNRATAELLETTARSLSDLVEDTTKTANATVVGVLGVLALVARNAGSLPAWLVIVATLAAVAGIGAVVHSRWGRISDQETIAQRLVHRLKNDPLLPDDERHHAVETITQFNLAERARSARLSIAMLGVIGSLVALSGAGWLVYRDVAGTSHKATPAVTTSTLPPTTRP